MKQTHYHTPMCDSCSVLLTHQCVLYVTHPTHTPVCDLLSYSYQYVIYVRMYPTHTNMCMEYKARQKSLVLNPSYQYSIFDLNIRLSISQFAIIHLSYRFSISQFSIHRWVMHCMKLGTQTHLSTVSPCVISCRL